MSTLHRRIFAGAALGAGFAFIVACSAATPSDPTNTGTNNGTGNGTGNGNGSGNGSGTGSGGTGDRIAECASPKAGWIWCDDFEQDRSAKYFEYANPSGSFVRATGVGLDSSSGMRVHFAAGQVDAGSLKLAFGRTPSSYFKPADAGTSNYREIYWRFYLRNQSGWTGGGGEKLTRAVVFSGSDWSEAAIGHLWSGGTNENFLVLDPVSATDSAGNVLASGYNDFAHFTWLGQGVGVTPLFDATHVGKWHCVEMHMKLNTAGQSDGVLEFWVDSTLENRRSGLGLVGAYSAYGINAIFLENYWNDGSAAVQERYLDNFVVSTQRVGC